MSDVSSDSSALAAGGTTALVDVLFLVLAVILLNEPRFDDAPDRLTVELPRGQSAEGSLHVSGSALSLGLDRDGRLFEGAREIAHSEWAALLTAYRDRGGQEVIIAADARAPLQPYVTLLTIASELGLPYVRVPIDPHLASASGDAPERRGEAR